MLLCILGVRTLPVVSPHSSGGDRGGRGWSRNVGIVLRPREITLHIRNIFTSQHTNSFSLKLFRYTTIYDRATSPVSRRPAHCSVDQQCHETTVRDTLTWDVGLVRAPSVPQTRQTNFLMFNATVLLSLFLHSFKAMRKFSRPSMKVASLQIRI